MPLPLLKKEKVSAAPASPSTKKQPNARFRVSGNKINFVSLGCPRNLVDTEVMIGILLKAGYQAHPQMKGADYVVINTCGFLEASRQESLSVIEEAMSYQKKGTKVIVTGCMVQKHSEQITAAFPNVDYLLGSGNVEGILKAVQSSEQGSEITSAKSYLEAGEVPRTLSTPKHYAYLKIAEGCRKQCAYCIIPQIKGPLQSKDIDQVLKEFRVLRKQGVKEIILIAQDLGDWGKDKGYKKTEGLIILLKEILKEEGDYWLRLLYLYPDEITPELIALMQQDPRICPYLDMPIQHINNTVLKSMYRATSREQIIDTLGTLRKAIPNITIRTSLIVGFPGETEEQFCELEQFLKEYHLDNVGIFKYSREPESRSAQMADQIPEEVKEERYMRLAEIQQAVVVEQLKKQIGKTIECIVEGYHPETQLLMVARHRGQCPEIDGIVLINDARKVKAFGERYQVMVTDVAGCDLVGHVVD